MTQHGAVMMRCTDTWGRNGAVSCAPDAHVSCDPLHGTHTPFFTKTSQAIDEVMVDALCTINSFKRERSCNDTHLANVLQELAKGHQDKVEMLLDRALALSTDIGDPITRVSLLSRART